MLTNSKRLSDDYANYISVSDLCWTIATNNVNSVTTNWQLGSNGLTAAMVTLEAMCTIRAYVCTYVCMYVLYHIRHHIMLLFTLLGSGGHMSKRDSGWVGQRAPSSVPGSQRILQPHSIFCHLLTWPWTGQSQSIQIRIWEVKLVTFTCGIPSIGWFVSYSI